MTTTPRQLCVPQTAFGRSPNARFRTGDGDGRQITPALTAAVVQHRLAILLRQQIAECDQLQDDYARIAQMTPNRLSQILGGHKQIRFTELAVLCKTLGPTFTAAIDARSWVQTALQPTESAAKIVPLTD
ncbi:MAG: hypothetical protein QM809_00670 [Gordonia sp. (in: high G+C Gram-positive bacteria)]|uniref:hypothetical protein n=1 Tax=Gordonia sp. (in: high G+C Gram-positive bacteria) TaxID=84139 RepID=UPI0039E4570A